MVLKRHNLRCRNTSVPVSALPSERTAADAKESWEVSGARPRRARSRAHTRAVQRRPSPPAAPTPTGAGRNDAAWTRVVSRGGGRRRSGCSVRRGDDGARAQGRAQAKGGRGQAHVNGPARAPAAATPRTSPCATGSATCLPLLVPAPSILSGSGREGRTCEAALVRETVGAAISWQELRRRRCPMREVVGCTWARGWYGRMYHGRQARDAAIRPSVGVAGAREAKSDSESSGARGRVGSRLLHPLALPLRLLLL